MNIGLFVSAIVNSNSIETMTSGEVMIMKSCEAFIRFVDCFQRRRVQLTPEQASDFYAEHFGKLFFPSLVAYMSSGPIVALMLARQDAVAYWRELIGPTNAVRARETHPDRYLFI